MKTLEIEAKYGIKIKPRVGKVAPKPLDLSSEEGQRLFRESLSRVMATHRKVIKALADR